MRHEGHDKSASCVVLTPEDFRDAVANCSWKMPIAPVELMRGTISLVENKQNSVDY
jgi:hypothetical protein